MQNHHAFAAAIPCGSLWFPDTAGTPATFGPGCEVVDQGTQKEGQKASVNGLDPWHQL